MHWTHRCDERNRDFENEKEVGGSLKKGTSVRQEKSSISKNGNEPNEQQRFEVDFAIKGRTKKQRPQRADGNTARKKQANLD